MIGLRGVGRAALVAAWLAAGAMAGAGASAASLPGTWLRYALPGAEVKSLVAPKGGPGRFVLGTAQGGIYHSTDGGKSWQGLPAGPPFPGFTVSGLAVDPVSSSILWAALTGVVRGSLLARTDDDGGHWSEVRRWPDRTGARVVAVTELSGRRVLAVGGDGGIEISVDGGESWRFSEPPLDPGSGISFLAFHPSRPDLLFAGSFRHPFVSSDLGRSWRRIASGMVEDTEVFDIDFSPADPKDLWAATCGWVYRTLNAGGQWVRFKEGLADRRTHTVRRDPRDGARVLAGTTGGLFESLDDGRTFHRVGPEAVVNAMAFDPSDPSVLLVGTEADGVLRSEDGGRTLRESNVGLSETRVSAVVTFPGRAVVARAADGRSGGLWSVDLESGRSARLPFAPPATIVAMAALGGRLYAGTSEGLYAADGTGSPFHLVVPLAVRGLLVDAGQLFAATSDGVVTSADGGKSWNRVGSLSGRIDGLFRVRFAGGATALAARARGVTWYRDRADWSDAPGARSADGPRLLAGGFGRAAAASSLAPQKVGVEVDVARGQLVFRGDGPGDEAVLLPVPESGLTVSDWAGDPRTADGLLLATIGRGLFRFVPTAEAAATGRAPRRTSPSARR